MRQYRPSSCNLKSKCMTAVLFLSAARTATKEFGLQYFVEHAPTGSWRISWFAKLSKGAESCPIAVCSALPGIWNASCSPSHWLVARLALVTPSRSSRLALTECQPAQANCGRPSWRSMPRHLIMSSGSPARWLTASFQASALTQRPPGAVQKPCALLSQT